MTRRRRLPGSLQGLALVLAVVVGADLALVGYAAARPGGDNLILPYSTTSVPAVARPGVDAYAASPEALGLVSSLSGPVSADESDPDQSLRHVLAELLVVARTDDVRRLRRRTIPVVESVLEGTSDGLVRHRESGRDVDRYPLPSGWVSAETQGLLLSVTSRLYRLTGDARWRREATRTFRTLLRFQGGRDGADRPFDPWLSLVDEYGWLWFERYPQGQRPSLTIASHATALIGIYDYTQIARGAHRDTAIRAFAQGSGTALQFSGLLVAERGPAWTSIWQISRSLRSHRQFTAQLRALAAMTGMAEFARTADVMTATGETYEALLRRSASRSVRLTSADAREKAARVLNGPS